MVAVRARAGQGITSSIERYISLISRFHNITQSHDSKSPSKSQTLSPSHPNSQSQSPSNPISHLHSVSHYTCIAECVVCPRVEERVFSTSVVAV